MHWFHIFLKCFMLITSIWQYLCKLQIDFQENLGNLLSILKSDENPPLQKYPSILVGFSPDEVHINFYQVVLSFTAYCNVPWFCVLELLRSEEGIRTPHNISQCILCEIRAHTKTIRLMFLLNQPAAISAVCMNTATIFLPLKLFPVENKHLTICMERWR